MYDIAQHHRILDFQIFFIFALFQEITTKITIHYKGKEEKTTTNYIKHGR